MELGDYYDGKYHYHDNNHFIIVMMTVKTLVLIGKVATNMAVYDIDMYIHWYVCNLLDEISK